MKNWTIDTIHSGIHFKIRHLVIARVRGTFNKWSGIVNLDEDDFTKSSVEVTIDAASIDTNEPQRDAHLRSADFFDVEKFPTLTFKSTKVEKAGGDDLELHGALTIHGVTKQIVLDVTSEGAGGDPWGGRRRGFTASGSIDRKDFGLHWNKLIETGGVAVGDKVELEFELELVEQAVKAA